MIEAELKAHVHNPDHVRRLLGKRAAGHPSIYRDTYYDRPDRELANSDRELRVRTIEEPDRTRHLLTYKEPPVDADSGSKPEHETVLTDRAAIEATLTGLGFIVDIAFEKHCENYRFTHDGREYLATLARVPEVGNDTFIEIEILVPTEDQVSSALAAIRTLLTDLGISPADLTTRYYQDLVTQHRTRQPAADAT